MSSGIASSVPSGFFRFPPKTGASDFSDDMLDDDVLGDDVLGEDMLGDHL